MATTSGLMDGAKEFVLTRELNAPRELVWKAWTERERLATWFGPRGFKMVKAEVDFRPGGVFFYGLESPTGQVMWGKWTFREIVPYERLVVVSSFSDEKGGVTRHPMAASWPLETLSTTTFSEKAGKTTLTIRWKPINATAEEIKMFESSFEGMNQGWGGTMAQLEEYLKSAS